MVNALTFDVEEYFQAEAFAGVIGPADWPNFESRVVAATKRLLDLLDEARVSATFFVLGWVAEREPALVHSIGTRGHEVACHGYGHQMITRMSRAQFAEDVRRGKAAVEDAAGTAAIGYRAPTFSVVRQTLWSLEVLLDAGFLYDSSIFPIFHDRYGIPDAPRFPHRRRIRQGVELAEFPLSTVARGRWRFPVAGGGYFRLFPYVVTRWAVRHLNEKEGQPAIMYFHPWELDLGQPRMPGGWWTCFRHSVNTASTEAKLRRLLEDFRFGPARDILAASGVLAGGGLA